MINRVFALHVELAVFLREHQHCHAVRFENSKFILVLAFMADIFGAFNHLNQQMQGGGANIIEVEEHLKAFQKKSNYVNDKQRMITSLIFLVGWLYKRDRRCVRKWEHFCIHRTETSIFLALR